MSIPRAALQEFRDCMEAAIQAGEIEPTAMTIATLGLSGGVAARMVLLKAFDEHGFVFYTNLESNKGRQLSAVPQAALVFYWKTIGRQVLVEGRVELLGAQEADDYFASRDRASQLGAWASQQSRPMKSRAELLKKVVAAQARYIGRPVPRPPHWSGYRVIPDMIEFWTHRNSRLHDRIRYTLDLKDWTKQRLFP